MLADAGLSADAIRGRRRRCLATRPRMDRRRRFIVAGPRGRLGPQVAVSGGDWLDPATTVRGGRRPVFTFRTLLPIAVPAEVAIEYGVRGGYVLLVGGATAGVEALWQAAHAVAGRPLPARRRADGRDVQRVRGPVGARPLGVRGPLVEAAACALLEGEGDVRYAAASVAAPLETLADRRAGETLACGPLVGLALAHDAGDEQASLTGHWRGRRMGVTLALAAAGAQA